MTVMSGQKADARTNGSPDTGAYSGVTKLAVITVAAITAIASAVSTVGCITAVTIIVITRIYIVRIWIPLGSGRQDQSQCR